MSRRRARKRILRALYRRDLLEGSGMEEAAASRDPYVSEVLAGIEAHREEIDRLIEAYAHGWPLPRLHTVDRNILRLAVYELLHREDVPPEVAIDEAVELAKIYGTERSPAFINGILDRIWKEVTSEVRGPKSEPKG